MDFSTGIDDIYYKNTCLWDPVKVKAKLMSLEGKIDTASRERTRRAMLEDARSYALRQRQVDATADHGDNSSCTSDGGKYGVMLSKVSYSCKRFSEGIKQARPWNNHYTTKFFYSTSLNHAQIMLSVNILGL